MNFLAFSPSFPPPKPSSTPGNGANPPSPPTIKAIWLLFFPDERTYQGLWFCKILLPKSFWFTCYSFFSLFPQSPPSQAQHIPKKCLASPDQWVHIRYLSSVFSRWKNLPRPLLPQNMKGKVIMVHSLWIFYPLFPAIPPPSPTLDMRNPKKLISRGLGVLQGSDFCRIEALI